MRVPFLFLLALTLVGCGSDGANEDGSTLVAQPVVGGMDAEILPVYDFEIGAALAGDPLTVMVPGDGGMIGIAIEFGSSLQGEAGFEVDESDYLQIHDYTVYADSSLSVDSDVGNAAFLGEFDIEVIDDLVYMPNVPHHPANRGFFQVITPEEIVNVQVIPGLFSSVEVSLGAGPAIWMSWGQLADLLDDELAPAWQRRAALATEVLDFVLFQMATITNTFNFINDELRVTNPAVIACDAFTGDPPLLVLPQGESTLTWLGPGNAPVSGDNFAWAFTDCWFDDAGSGYGTLLNGAVGLNDIVWDIDNLSRLVGAGFREVAYEGLVVAGTVEDPAGVFTISPDDVATVSGSFDLVFREPGD